MLYNNSIIIRYNSQKENNFIYNMNVVMTSLDSYDKSEKSRVKFDYFKCNDNEIELYWNNSLVLKSKWEIISTYDIKKREWDWMWERDLSRKIKDYGADTDNRLVGSILTTKKIKIKYDMEIDILCALVAYI